VCSFRDGSGKVARRARVVDWTNRFGGVRELCVSGDRELSAGSVFLFLSLAFLFSGSGACACECAIRAVNAAANGSSMRVDDSAWTTIHMYIRTQTGPREGTQTDSCLRQEASTMDRMIEFCC
jgi:hypothetical protein